ncbi:hypothetical protein ACFQDG_10615 [Natronoarchaeum mannanilyticum]
MAGSTFGFTTVAADRVTAASVAEDQNAYLGVESVGSAGQLRSDSEPVRVGTLTNNLGASMTIDDVVVDNINGSTNADVLTVSAPRRGTSIAQGGSTDVHVECAQKQQLGQREVQFRVTEASSQTVSIAEVTFTATIDIQCQKGRNKPGNGFASVSVEDVDSYTSPGQERQTIRFTPSSKLQPNSEVIIDVSEPHPSAVDYEAPPSNWPDVYVEQGQGSVTYDSGTESFIYQAGSNDRGGNEIMLSIGEYGTSQASSSHQVSITRQDSGEQALAVFDVVESGTRPIESVTVSDVGANVQPGDERQMIGFDLGTTPSGSDPIEIDLSEAQGNGVDYMAGDWPDTRVEQGGGSVHYDENSQSLIYWPNNDGASDRIEISVGDYGTESSGGPYEVAIYRADADYEASDTFSIE